MSVHLLALLLAAPAPLAHAGGTGMWKAPAHAANMSLPAAFSAARSGPVPLFEAAAVAPVDPAWIVAEEDDAESKAAKARVLKALSILHETPSGRDFERLLTEGGAQVRIRRFGSLWVDDGDNAVVAGPEFMEGRTDWLMAVFMAHELEHIRQRALGLGRDALGPDAEKARGVRELTATLVQSRVWTELGAPEREQDRGNNWNNSRDMEAWAAYPRSMMSALLLRTDNRFDVSVPEVKAYWEKTLAEEEAWREANRDRLPDADKSKEAALFVLEQACRFHGGLEGEVSGWLPEYLERASSLAPGRSLALPSSLSAKDRAVLSVFPGDVRVSEDGRSLLRPEAHPPKTL